MFRFTGSSKKFETRRKNSRRRTILGIEQFEGRMVTAADTASTMADAAVLGKLTDSPIVINEQINVFTDVDLYKFEVQAGQQVGFDIDTPSNGPPGLGSYLRIFNVNGSQLASNNDANAPDDPPPPKGSWWTAPGLGFDSYISYKFDVGGTYYVGVSNWLNSRYNPLTGVGSSGGSLSSWGTGSYSLIVTATAPIASAVIEPISLKASNDGSIRVNYRVTQEISTTNKVPISVYWASGNMVQYVLPGLSPKPIFTHQHDPKLGVGEFFFTITKTQVTTASNEATHLIVVAKPEPYVRDTVASKSILAKAVNLGSLTASQLQAAMPSLKAADAARFVEPLNKIMSQRGIKTLEQRSMFLAQIGHESLDLTLWPEEPSGSPTNYFTQKYWISKSRWNGLGASYPTVNGLTLRIPAASATAAVKSFDLYFARGDRLSNSATMIARIPFTKTGNFYTANFAGAIPPSLTSHLLIVDPSNSNRVVSAINQKSGNWRPQDAVDFRGRGPIQLTGRYNYALFARDANQPQVMTNPSLVSDSTNPQLGFESAGWFWLDYKKPNLNGVVDDQAGKTSQDLNNVVTKIVNGGYNGEQDRLQRYRRVRAILIG